MVSFSDSERMLIAAVIKKPNDWQPGFYCNQV
jgi:hypothetical protein